MSSPAVEAALRARELCASAGPGERDEDRRARYRALGSVMSSGEVAEALGSESVELAVVTYRFDDGVGRIAPPVDVVVRCRPEALEGVYRSMAKLLESRGWSSQARVSRTRAARGEVERGAGGVPGGGNG